MRKTVTLVAFAGRRRVFGLNQLVEGNLDDPLVFQAAQARLASFLDGASTSTPYPGEFNMSLRIPRHVYVDHYGPTVGDRLRLADTELIIEVERDYTVYGDEVKFGGGKVIRDGMGQSPEATSAQGVPDLVITNALIIDYWGIVKADVAIKEGKIVGIGKAGNRNLMDGVTPGMEIGASTEDLGRRRADPHRWRHRCTHPFHLAATDPRGPV